MNIDPAPLIAAAGVSSSSVCAVSATSTSSSLPLRHAPSNNDNLIISNQGNLYEQIHRKQRPYQHQRFHELSINDPMLLNEQSSQRHNHQQVQQPPPEPSPSHNNMSPMLKLRRGSAENSYAHSSEAIGAWSGFNFNTPITNSTNPSTSSYMYRNQPCLEVNTTQSMAYPQHHAWPPSATSDAFSPTSGIDHIPDFNHHYAMNHDTNNGYQVNPVLVSPGPLQHSNYPTSPPFSASSSDNQEGRQDSNQEPPTSPTFSTVAQIIRRDGIRKKNARFDIPAERNLKTIDQLIHTTNDESELKELKQQKRLLRNRQAALDSRQRKKQHTERLEEEKKQFCAVVNELEDALQDSKAREHEWIREKEMWASTQQQYLAHIDDLRMHQEELVRQHTIETGDLRRKNAMLMEQLQRMDSTTMSNAPSSHGVSAEYSDFDQMNYGAWDNSSMAQEFTIENNHGSAQEQAPATVFEAEKPAASAILLMLLLCGAWVASRSNATQENVLPALPDEMRAASANILDNLYKDSGVQLDGVNSVTKSNSRQATKTVLSAIESSGSFTSNLDVLHQRLTAPSAQQLRDQAFSLTPSQYYDMTSGDARYQQAYYDHHRELKASGGPVQQSEQTLAETYTKSLLRDKVSTQILKDFARMVAQSNLKPPVVWKTEEP